MAAQAPAIRRAIRRVVDSTWLYRVLTLVIGLAIWQVATTQGGSHLLTPTVPETAAGIASLLVSPAFWNAMIVTNQALVIGFAISVVAGIPTGLAMGRFRRVELFTDVYVNILVVTPMAATFPLLMMSIGIGLSARVLVVVLFAMVMVTVNTRAGVRQVNPTLIDMARCFGADERQVWTTILLPAALPAIMTGIRIAVGRAVTGMVIVELLLVAAGIGALILDFEGQLEAGLMYGTIILVVLESILLIQAARWIERRVAPWAYQSEAFRN